MTTQTIPFGERLGDGRIVTASEVPRGAACGCVCPECGGPLQAHHGDVLRWHFQHQSEQPGCRGGTESALHKFAKQVIAEKRAIWLPPLIARHTLPQHFPHELQVTSGRWARLGNLRLEERVTCETGEFIVPDILAEMAVRDRDNKITRSDVAIEIVVTHFASDNKRKLFEALRLPAFEISLSGILCRHHPTLYDCTADVLRDAPRSWLWHEKQKEINAIYEDAFIGREIVRLKHFERQRRRNWRANESQRFYFEMLEARNAIVADAVREADDVLSAKQKELRFQLEWTEKWHGRYAADRLLDWSTQWRKRQMPAQAAE